MKLGIDLDGVIAEYREYGSFAEPSPTGTEWWHPENFGGLPVVEGAIAALSRLKLDGHTIKIITARPVHPMTFEWLQEHAIPFDTIDHTSAKWNIPCHVYFDDGNRFLNGFHERGLVAVKMRYPHNINAPARYEVDDWQGFLDLIRRPIKGKLRKNPRRLHRVGTSDGTGMMRA